MGTTGNKELRFCECNLKYVAKYNGAIEPRYGAIAWGRYECQKCGNVTVFYKLPAYPQVFTICLINSYNDIMGV